MEKGLSEAIVSCFRHYLGDNLVSIILFGSTARGEARNGSDVDLFIVAERLPISPLKRLMFIRKPLAGQFTQRLSIIAKTKEEVMQGISPLLLDLAVDRIILYDTGFMEERLGRIKAIIKDAGLYRVTERGQKYWTWRRQPRAGWVLDWEGLHEISR